MTFTYDTSNPTDITSVRYHLADTVEADAIWTDEDITYAITLNDGSWQRAVISLMEQYVTILSRTPDFNADWLSVNASSAISAWTKLLSDKRREFGLSAITANVVHTYRADSREWQSPDYTQDNDNAYD